MLRWFDGFDYYATADLTSQYNLVGGSFAVVPLIGRFSSGAIRNALAGGGETITKFLTAQGTWIVGFAYQFTVGGKATTVVSLQLDTSAAVELRMTTGNLLTVTNNGAVLATGTTVLLPNTYYYLEVKAVLGSGNVTVRVNGIAEITLVGGGVGQTTANRVNLHYDQFQVQNIYDDFYVCDGTGTVNNDFLGDMRVEALAPSGAGFYQEWALTGAATSTAATSEATPDGDTSYVSSGTLNQRETFAFADLASVPSAIAGLKVTAITRKDDAGTRAITPLIRASTVDYLGSALGVGDSYGYLVSIFETNPATSAPWTGGDVNALEAGWKLTT